MELEDLARKESFENVEKHLGQGMSREQVFRKLGGTDDLARVIVSVPLKEDRIRYTKENDILIGVLAYIIIMKAITIFIGVSSLDHGWVILPFALVHFLVSAFLISQLRIFRGWAYSLASLYCMYLLFNNVEVLFSDIPVTGKLITALLMIPIVAGSLISLQLKKSLCPYLGFWGAKTDDDGGYLFLKPTNKAL